jgi:hypothetical protein
MRDGRDGPFKDFFSFPVCAARAQPLHDEYKSKESSGKLEAFQEVLNAQRKCDNGFIEWKPALSLRDHQDLKDQLDLRKWQENEAAKQAKREADDRQWRTEQAAKEDKREDRRDRRQLVALIVMVAGVIVPAVLSCISMLRTPRSPTINVEPAAVTVQPPNVTVQLPASSNQAKTAAKTP